MDDFFYPGPGQHDLRHDIVGTLFSASCGSSGEPLLRNLLVFQAAAEFVI